MLTNHRDNLARRVIDPRAYLPCTAMPALGVIPSDGVDIARYPLMLR